jgi:acyl-CoA-binding protein
MKKSFITLILISVALVSFAQIRGGQRNGQRNGGQPSSQSTNVKLPKAFFFDAQNGVCKFYELNRHGKLASKIYERDGLNRSWDIVFGYEAKWKHFAFFYDNESGTIKIYNITDGTLGDKTYSREGLHKGWDIIKTFEDNYQPYILFYDSEKGLMKVYRLTRQGTIGDKVSEKSGLRAGWDNITIFNSNNKAYISFYDRNGTVKNYFLLGGKLGRKLSEYNNMGQNWDNISSYSVGFKTYIVFQGGYNHAIKICEIGSDGHFGPTNYQRPGFIHFDLINIYKWEGKHYMCCYDGDTRSMQTFRLEDHGEIGMMEPAENGLRTTWKAVYVY